MTTLRAQTMQPHTPAWLWVTASLGLLWNAYGIYQFIGTFTEAGQAAMTAGMTKSQADLYLSLPNWISLVFAIGVFGGMFGSIALALRRKISLPIFAVSLVGYCLLFAGDIYYGVFAAIPSQLAILAMVVIIAAALLAASRIAVKRGLLD